MGRTLDAILGVLEVGLYAVSFVPVRERTQGFLLDTDDCQKNNMGLTCLAISPNFTQNEQQKYCDQMPKGGQRIGPGQSNI